MNHITSGRPSIQINRTEDVKIDSQSIKRLRVVEAAFVYQLAQCVKQYNVRQTLPLSIAVTWRRYLSGRGETDTFVVVIKRRVECPDESVAEDPERVIETTSDKGRQANRVSSHLRSSFVHAAAAMMNKR